MSVPANSADERRHRQELAAGVNQALRGEMDILGSVTFAAGTTSTTISDSRLTIGRLLMLSPLSQAAASCRWWVQSLDKGAAVIGHDSPATDISFTWAVIGTAATR